MPFNLLKKYNQLLEISGYSPFQRTKSLKAVFKSDIQENPKFSFCDKKINPTSKDGEIPMDTLFTHLTTEVVDEKTKQREFEMDRSVRLHWIKHHIDQKQKEGMLVFSTADKNGDRTYIYDTKEMYVIVLEPLKKINEYYLLTAYHLKGKNQYKIASKYKRRMSEVL